MNNDLQTPRKYLFCRYLIATSSIISMFFSLRALVTDLKPSWKSECGSRETQNWNEVTWMIELQIAYQVAWKCL